MSSLPSGASRSLAPAAPVAWATTAATILLALAAPVGVMTFRALPLVIGLALAALVLGGDWRGAVTRIGRQADRRLLGAIVLFLGLALVSLAWAEEVRRAAVVLAVVVLFAALGLFAWASAPDLDRRRLGLALSLGFALAAVLILVEMNTDMMLHRLGGGTSNPSKMNQAAVLMALWLWPVLCLVADRWGRGTAVALLLVTGLGILGSHSETARLAVRLALLAWILVWIGWRWLPALMGAGLFVFTVTQPWLMAVLQQWMPQVVVKAFQSGHAAERITIWTSFSHAVELWPWTGVGFNGSGLIGFGPRISLFPESLWVGIKDSHPHNMFLQAWVEMGVLGGLLLACIWLAWALAVWRQPWRRLSPFGTAVLAAAPIVALVGYGAWQAWWIAVLAPLPVLFRLAGADEPVSPPRG